MMMFILGISLGCTIGILTLALFAAGKPEIDSTESFEQGISYALSRNKIDGAIIATNNNEIMVEYANGIVKRFRDVTDE
jgi:hypothetical protein